MKKIKFISLCSGIEAASVAFAPLGWKAIAYSEIEKFPSAVLDHHYPNTPNLGDLTKVDWSKYKNKADLVCFGSPCQAFSVAGLRRSLKDERGNLSLRIVQAVHAINPTYVLSENVPGWLSTKDNAFGCFLAGIVGADAPLRSGQPGGSWTSAGVVFGPKYGLAWRVLDAQYFGVPQRRERVFVVASALGWRSAAQILFKSESLRRNPSQGGEARKDVAGTISARTKGGGGFGTDFELNGGLVAKACNAKGGSETTPPLTTNPYGDHESREELLIVHALKGEGFDASEDGTGRGTPIIPIQEPGKRTGKSTDDPRAGIGIGKQGDPMFTLQSGAQHAIFDMRGNGDGKISPTLTKEAAGDRPSDYAPMIFDPYNNKTSDKSTSLGSNCGQSTGRSLGVGAQVRRLLPIECERLQGFPDNFTAVPYRGKPAADGPRYKAIGNSWAIPVVRWIGERIEAARKLK